MPLELLGFIRKGGKYHAPVRRVRCHCGAIYARAGSASDIRRAGGCVNCRAASQRIYASPKERKRAQNQRYWAKRKLRMVEA